MSTSTLPDPLVLARAEAEKIRNNRQGAIYGGYEFICAETPWADPQALIHGLEAFHKERMSRIPSPAKYPEAKPFVEHRLALDAQLQKLAGMSDLEMALYRSVGHFVTYRGYRQAAQAGRRTGPQAAAAAANRPTPRERCRVVHMPQSDRGQFHIKNVDDPPTNWQASPGRPDWLSTKMFDLIFDGTGSGLHLDTEPEDLFPIEATAIAKSCCSSTPEAIEFFKRYLPFYGGGNFVISDSQGRTAAVEHCSRNFIEVFLPGPDGRSHCSGMACRDPNSPQGRHQRAMREEYLRISGLANNPMDTVDVAFWSACDRAEQMLAHYLTTPESCKVDHIFSFFLTPFPNGLCKDGVAYHPTKSKVKEYTLVTHGWLLDQRTYIRYQRSNPPELKMPTEPEVYTY